MKKYLNLGSLIILFIGSVMIAGAALVAADQTKSEPSTDSLSNSADSTLTEYLLVTYFHGNARCVTCRKMEAFAKEALDSTFAKEQASGTVKWRTVNFDDDGNEHFLGDYKLFGQALILSWMKDGKEMEYANLDQIWQLVRDKEKYLEYVRTEVTGQLEKKR